jgi:hypothetical protein
MHIQAKNLHLQFGENFKALWILGSGKSLASSGYGLAAAEAAGLPRRLLEISKSALHVERKVPRVVKYDGSEYCMLCLLNFKSNGSKILSLSCGNIDSYSNPVRSKIVL